MLELDHLAVAARTLDEGRAYVERALGLRVQPGGRHGRYGTHNLLAGLEDGLYLEVIAIDPQAVRPRDSRWFRLDEFSGAPCLHNWICRTGDMAADLPSMPAGSGRPVDLERGDLRWQMAVPGDGRLPFDDLSPALIQWQGRHPAPALRPTGARLERLELHHPRAGDLAAHLSKVFTDTRVAFIPAQQPKMTARFNIDGQVRWL